MQSAFAVVWCPASVAFHCSEWAEDDLIQAVQMSDEKSSILRVLYRLERPSDREWRIAACRAHRSAGRRV